MGFLSSAFFWGGLVVFIGLSIILRAVGVKFPLFSFALGLFFLWLGASIIVNAVNRTRARGVAFDDAKVEVTGDASEYSTVFGRSDVDLTTTRPEGSSRKVEVDAVFGAAVVRIDPNVPMRIQASAAFGSVRLPDGNSVAFGDMNYQTRAFKPDSACIVLKASAVFGSVEIIEAPGRARDSAGSGS